MSYNSHSGYYQPGEAKHLIDGWLRNFPVETEFYYGVIAEDCDVPKPTVSADLLKRARAPVPTLKYGSRQGWYEKILPAEAEAVNKAAPEDKAAANRDPGVGDLLEVIGAAKDGSLLLRDAHQVVWRAEAL